MANPFLGIAVPNSKKEMDLYMNFTYLLILAMVIWGISWPIAKNLSNFANLDILIFWRNLATVVSLLPMFLFLRDKLHFTIKGMREALYGALLMTLYNYLFFAGVKTGLPGAGGVLVTTLNPLINFLLVTIIYGHNWKKKEFYGLLVGLIGGLVLLQFWKLNPESLYKGGNLFFLIASLTWAFLSIQTHRSKKHMDPVTYSFFVYLLSTVFTFFPAYQGDWTAPLQFGWHFWLNLFYLAGISTAFGTTIYFVASTKLGSHRASAFIFIVPASAALSSWFILGENPTLPTFIGGSLALLAARILKPPEEK